LHLEKVAKAFSTQYWKNLDNEHFPGQAVFCRIPFASSCLKERLSSDFPNRSEGLAIRRRLKIG
jgi:hypothetical protein